jgi:hypothetical protein
MGKTPGKTKNEIEEIGEILLLSLFPVKPKRREDAPFQSFAP